jgi:thiol:disulfide interchange protein
MAGAHDFRRPLGAFVLALASLAAAGRAGAHPQDLVKWRPIVAGEAEAKKAGKLVLYFFTAEWCGPCHLLEEQVFSQKAVADQIARDYVPVIVRETARETGKNAPEMQKLADRYGLRGFPTLIVSRPGFDRGIVMEGWDGPEQAIAYLKSARQRFLTAEKSSKKKT